MFQRWACAAWLEADKNFRCVRGYRDMHKLIAALDTRSPSAQATQVA